MSGEERRRPFLRWISQPEMLVALSAVVLSLCGPFISIYEASLMRREQRASVWPHVEAASSIRDDEIEVWIRNTGLGPARIDGAALTYEGEVLGDWGDLVRRLGIDGSGLGSYQSLIGGRVLPADSEREVLFRLYGTADSEGDDLPRLAGAILDGTVDVSVCYWSVYDACRSSSMRDLLLRSRGVDPGPHEAVDDCRSHPRSGI